MIAASSVLYYYTSPFHYMTGNLTPATFDHHILFTLCFIHTETQSGQNKVGFASSWSGKPQSIKLCSDLSIREKKKGLKHRKFIPEILSLVSENSIILEGQKIYLYISITYDSQLNLIVLAFLKEQLFHSYFCIGKKKTNMICKVKSLLST